MNAEKQIYFKNREFAAEELLKVLPIDKMKLEEWVVLSTSLYSIQISKIIADRLNAEFDIMFNEKIFSPNNKSCELAIVTEHEEVLIHEEILESFNIELDYIYNKSKDIYEGSLKQTITKYRHGKTISELKNKNVLLVDEGINTGLTMMACIKTAVNLNAKSVCVATPVLPYSSITCIEDIADDLFYVESPKHFVSIDFYYETLESLELEEIEKILNKG